MATNIFGEIHLWSKQLTHWQNEGIRRLFKNGTLSDADKTEIFNFAKIENSLSIAPTKLDLKIKIGELPTPPILGQKIHLSAIRDVVGVNSLKSDQRLTVGKQLTIVYGENGAGKSGYARIMKRACRARAVDAILPNVYASSTSGPANAIFEIEENGTTRQVKWVEGGSIPICLGRFSVFDSKCARVYINDNNELGFLPYGFDILKGLTALTDDIKAKFQQLAIPPTAELLKPFNDTTEIGKKIVGLSALSDEATIKQLGDWTQEHLSQLQTKEKDLAGLKAKSPEVIRQNLISDKKRLERLRSAIEATISAVSPTRIDTIKSKCDKLQKFEEAVVAAAKLAFEEIDLPGIGGAAWRELLKAAMDYSTKDAYPQHPFPANSPEAKCLLCLRPIDHTTQARLQGFWDFIQNDVSSKRDTARIALDQEIKALNGLPTAIPQEFILLEDVWKASGSKVFELLEPFYQAVACRVNYVQSALKGGPWDSIPAEAPTPLVCIDKEIEGISEKLLSLADDTKVNALIESLNKEVLELKARQRLNGDLPQILEYLKALKLANLALRAGNKINTKAISIKSSELQSKFVTDRFTKSVTDELEPLGLLRVKPGIEKKPEKGKVLLRLTVLGTTKATPDAVFSEGERTAISLACFLAELSLGEDNCGIILDDPVSSLDHRVRGHIVKRLVDEAVKRQVIIFTHDLVCYRELMAAAAHKSVSVQFQHVESLGTITGILNDTPPWIAQKVSQRINGLDAILARLKKTELAGDVFAYRSDFGQFYSLLRSTWERSIEEILFNQVVERLEKEVKSLRLDKVFVDNESIEAVFTGMTKTSAMIEAHDHAVAENTTLPGSDELVKDLDALKNFKKKQEEKQKKAEADNAHLKKGK